MTEYMPEFKTLLLGSAFSNKSEVKHTKKKDGWMDG